MKSGFPSRGIDADENLAMVKSDDVGRSRVIHKLSVHPGDHLIGDEADLHLIETAE